MDRNRCYNILGLNNQASDEDVKKAYRKLAMTHHPDKGGDENKFKEITQAYEKITNKNFDDHNPRNNDHFDPFDMMFRHHFGAHRQTNVNVSAGQQKQKRKVLIEKNIEISLKELFHGVTRKLSIKNEENCPHCNNVCTRCNGSGTIIVEERRQMGFASFINTSIRPCDRCKGSGKQIITNECKICNNTRKINVDKVINIDIEPGHKIGYLKTIYDVITGTDLKINIKISSDEKLQYINDGDLLVEYEIDFIDTIFGKKLYIEHPSGETIQLDTRTTNNIINNEQRLNIKGRGIKSEKNLIIAFNVKYNNLKDLSNVNVEEHKRCYELLKNMFTHE
jgi:DnaJ homolog subfamily A member 2